MGSTAGGFKIVRLMIIIRFLHLLLIRTAMPSNAVAYAYVGKDRLEDSEIHDALIVVLLFIVVIFVSWLPFVAGGYDPINALFEVVSATGTVGLSTGITGPELEPFLKGILCADMLLGRLEIVAWLILFYPRTWFGQKKGV
jgi:trk system potassium uptake protein TrkH